MGVRAGAGYRQEGGSRGGRSCRWQRVQHDRLGLGQVWLKPRTSRHATGWRSAHTLTLSHSHRNNQETCRLMFREQCEWAAEAGVDLIIGETFDYIG